MSGARIMKIWRVPRRPYTGTDHMVTGPDGVRRYGTQGAAGLIVYTPLGARAAVLLAQRSYEVHHGGSWAVPGGARNVGESAVDCAVREAREEIDGLDVHRLALQGTHEIEFPGGWTYTYVLARYYGSIGSVSAGARWETLQTRWTPWDAVQSFAHGILHPDFEAAVPALTQRFGSMLR